MPTRLFDDIERTDATPAREEDSFTFLNRVATPYWDRVRSFAEEAFGAYPREHAADLRARFRDRRWSTHIGAWWELYLYTLFRSLGLEVEVHPRLSGVTRRPDFLVGSDENSFFVEARHVAAGLRSDEGRIGRDEWITAPLDDLTHPDFMVAVRIVERASQRPRRTAVTRGVLAWLDSLDADAVAARPEARQSFSARAGGWRFELSALPVKPEARGRERRLVGIYPGYGGTDNTAASLRAALKEKAARYGRTGSPFILAPLLTSGFVNIEDVLSALFGTEVMRISIDAPEQTTMSRAPDGFWVSGEGFRGTRISAILLGDTVLPWTVGRSLPRLWIHPAAAHPLPDVPLLPTATVDSAGDLSLSDGGRTGSDVFGLADGWPGPEGPFDISA